MSREPVFDADNPEWTSEDFARAKPLGAFPELEAALRAKVTAKRPPPRVHAVPLKTAG